MACFCFEHQRLKKQGMKANRRLSKEAEMVFAEFIYAISEYRNGYAVDAIKLVRGRRSFNLLVDAVCSCQNDNIYSREKRDLLCGLLAGENKFHLTKKQQILVANAIARENVMRKYDAQEVLERCNGNLCEKARKILEKTANIFTSA
ncbi:hypothetical protein COV61_04620 [Candidatus Micrarchaeota archaeon CG11_big_fil_rev_8_21_14_0_20_47_5]|nr:MAG: hypothetical protein AUJ17_03055 [Candidatus Micrarchaeota archaeon CG1_02_47_40]PIN82909.1 MAG: hypothetical protein COV61_04620 [Candidatus Micrarchaeota archaeon CG11_big_fil_rev_8_21_14_0_20_47_5]